MRDPLDAYWRDKVERAAALYPLDAPRDRPFSEIEKDMIDSFTRGELLGDIAARHSVSRSAVGDVLARARECGVMPNHPKGKGGRYAYSWGR